MVHAGAQTAHVLGLGAAEAVDWDDALGVKPVNGVLPRDAHMMVDENDTVDHWVAYYREQIEESRAITASLDLDSPCARKDIIECNVRYVLFHMIEETAPRRPRGHHPRDLGRRPSELSVSSEEKQKHKGSCRVSRRLAPSAEEIVRPVK
jgi:hypothetical protein